MSGGRESCEHAGMDSPSAPPITVPAGRGADLAIENRGRQHLTLD
jgi:hypothetical protein